MNSARFNFLIREAVVFFRRGKLRTWLSVATIAIALTILGGFLLLSYNVTKGLQSFRQESKIVAYLAPAPEGVSQRDFRRGIESELEGIPSVEAVEYISKDEALERFRERFGADNPLLEAVDENPLPASFEIQLAEVPEDMESVVGPICAIAGLEDLAYGQEALETLSKVATVVKGVVLFLGIVLAFFTVVIVSNTIKLTVYARKTEIEIMQLVGATRWFIRTPFLLEGAIQGFLAACFAIVLLRLSYSLIAWQLERLYLPFDFLPSATAVGLFFTGILMGVVGVLVSMGEFLDLEEE